MNRTTILTALALIAAGALALAIGGTVISTAGTSAADRVLAITAALCVFLQMTTSKAFDWTEVPAGDA